MMIRGKTFEAADVLAGAYRGKAVEDRALLVHTVEIVNGSATRVLCRGVKLDNLIMDSGPTDREPTCPKCAERLAKIRAGRTAAQQQRQSREHRSGGQYAKVNPCNACGRSAGINYCSDHRTDEVDGFSDFICLCERCATQGEKMGDSEALAFYAAGGAK